MKKLLDWIKANWPWMRRETHERVLTSECAAYAKRILEEIIAGQVADAAKRFAESRAQCALVRAEAAEAQLQQLAAPLVETSGRLVQISIAEIEQKSQICVTLQLSPCVWHLFSGHGRALGYCVRELVHATMVRLREHDKQAAEPGFVPGKPFTTRPGGAE